MTDKNSQPNAAWTSREAYLLALVCLTVGLLLGYIFRGSAPIAGSLPAVAGAAAPATGGPTNHGPAPTAESLQLLVAPLLAALKANSKNFETLVEIGNLYYDHRVYPEAIEYYTRALELRPNDVNARTDLGTAFWYGGFPEKAIAEYQKSLAVDPTHANTLFNLGVVRSDGLKDFPGAVAAWEKLLRLHPDYPEKQRVLELIEEARKQKR